MDSAQPAEVQKHCPFFARWKEPWCPSTQLQVLVCQSHGHVDKALQAIINWWKVQGELGLKSHLECEARAGFRRCLGQEAKVHPAIGTAPPTTIELELSVTDTARIYRTLYIEYVTENWVLDSITANRLWNYGTRVLIRLPKFDDDDIFGQAGVSSPGIIRFTRFKSDWVFRHWETRQPEGFMLCPSHPTSQVFRNNYGVTIAKMDVPSESRPWSTALVIKIWALRWWCSSI